MFILLELNMEIATFGGGCFWGVEASFKNIKGVISTKVGYMGGTITNPTYEDVCTDKTGHIEVVQLIYDPYRVSYYKLLEIFWNIHDPTQYNRQGPDIGTQYRSVIFFHNEKQKKIAEKSRIELEESRKYKKRIVTEIIKATKFYLAEEYHQKYYQKKGNSRCNF